MDRGVISFGCYIPRLRISRAAIAAANSWAFPSVKGRGQRALANWDEDPVTMAVEAARGVDTTAVETLVFASTTAPFADLQNAALVAAALGLADTISTSDLGGSVRAGASALLGALRSDSVAPTLVAVADARRAKPGSSQEMTYGAGAVALTVGGGDGVIAKLVGVASRADPFIDHFRAAGQTYDYHWEERWVRDEGYAKIIPKAVEAALERAGVAAADIAHFCLPAPQPSIPIAVCKAVGIPAKAIVDPLQDNCGDTGAAHPLMLLAAALERASAGDRIVVASFGAGCDVMIFEATAALANHRSTRKLADTLAAGHVEQHYTKLLSFHGELNLDWGMRAEGAEKIPLTQQYRARGQLPTFSAGECPDCGAIQFPQMASCINCGSFAPLAQTPLADVPAHLASYTADWLQYHPAPPFCFGLVQFENGARVMMEVVDADPGALEVGTRLRMVYRIKSIDSERGYIRYFWKATPLLPSQDL